jgi:hypothetical protein
VKASSAHHNERMLLTLSLDEFLRRFLLHLFPKGSCAFATSVSWPNADALNSCRFVFICSARPRKLSKR